MYRIVRVNRRDHNTYALALEDMGVIIDHKYYWKMSQRVHMPVGTMVIAAGSYEGAGMFLIGIVTGEWEIEPHPTTMPQSNKPSDYQYHQRIPVQWQPVVYWHDKGVDAVHEINDMIDGFNYRFGATLTQVEFRKVLNYVLHGKAISPWEYEQAQAA